MPPEIINHTRIQGNECFGCGVHNSHGLHIELTVDPGQPDRLVGTFVPRDYMVGFPGITHGARSIPRWTAWVPGCRRC